MSTIKHTWHTGEPPEPDVYTTRLNESKYLTLRYWDGAVWFDISYTKSRSSSKAFTWPKDSRARRPEWARRSATPMSLRLIGKFQGDIQWGTPYRVYDEKEVLAYLVNTGRLPADWRNAYQIEMRAKPGDA